MFKRLDQAMQEKRMMESKKLRRTSREYFPRNVHTSNSNPNHNNVPVKRTVTEFNEAPILDLRTLTKNPQKPTIAEELLKSHHDYQPTKSQRS